MHGQFRKGQDASHADFQDLYGVLGVTPMVPFDLLRRAYYQRAKECHPDRFPGQPAKEDEFKLLVHAFDVLSDPLKRERYDDTLALRLATAVDPDAVAPHLRFDEAAGFGETIMDTRADDTLEEFVVGIQVPAGITLQSLMRDLEGTVNFMRFREAKTALHAGRCHVAYELFHLGVKHSPMNILYHYHLGLAAERLGRYGVAEKEYRLCLDLGWRREPVQRLQRIRQRLFQLRERHGGLRGRLANLLNGAPPEAMVDQEERLIAAHTRHMSRLLQRPPKTPKPAPPPEPHRLPPVPPPAADP